MAFICAKQSFQQQEEVRTQADKKSQPEGWQSNREFEMKMKSGDRAVCLKLYKLSCALKPSFVVLIKRWAECLVDARMVLI